jgi:hypothetical protein
MSDEETYSPAVRQFIENASKLLDSMPRAEPLPPEVAEAARALDPYTEVVQAAMKPLMDYLADTSRIDAIGARYEAVFAEMLAALPLPVPTPQELAEADQALRTRVVPETSEEELQEAVTRIPADSEKVKLAAFLSDVLRNATGLPAPWAAFVLVFCIALTMNPDVVAALAFAYVVMQDVRRDG